jgi:hypothetical protein
VCQIQGAASSIRATGYSNCLVVSHCSNPELLLAKFKQVKHVQELLQACQHMPTWL